MAFLCPPMPSPYTERQSQMPEEVILNRSSEELVVNKDANPYKRGRRGYETTSGEWERKAALKCIKELRLKKKFEPSLVCKICKDKTFTATATLMYHYRSHAGIKPFVCLICNTTFTRQHSLNYHMLIHNNQSRFTCKECGRKFRHPSHFKEHMRRHTGETPYHCTDCPLRFKTRNTYKRHLRTRHDKLLTVLGIRFMTQEEIARNDSLPESDKDDGDESTESDTSLEDVKHGINQRKLIPIQPKPPFDEQQPSVAASQQQPAKDEAVPKVTITDDSPLGQIQSIESTSKKTMSMQNTTSTLTHTTVTPVKIGPSLFVTQQALPGSGGTRSLISTVAGSGICSPSGMVSTATVTPVMSATPTLQLQVPTIMAATQQPQQQVQTLNLATLPRVQLLTASGQPIHIPQLQVQAGTVPQTLAQLTTTPCTVGPQLVLAAAPTTPVQATNTINLAGTGPNTANRLLGAATNGLINVPLNPATFHMGSLGTLAAADGGQSALQTLAAAGGQTTLQTIVAAGQNPLQALTVGQNNTVQTLSTGDSTIQRLTVASGGQSHLQTITVGQQNQVPAGAGISLFTVAGNPQNAPTVANTVTLQMNTETPPIILANNNLAQPALVSYAAAVSHTSTSVAKASVNCSSSLSFSTGSGGASVVPDSSAPTDTPATNTLLKFCTQVANQVGQVMPQNM